MSSFIQNLNDMINLLSKSIESIDWIETGHALKENALKIAGASLIGLTAAYIAKIYYNYGTFERMNIETPPFKFIHGHFKEIKEKGYSIALQKWTEKYGRVYGIYEGHLPILVTSDPDMVQEIFVKQFSNFSARKQFAFSFEDDSPLLSLFFASKGRWRRQRNIINPTFSTARVKELMPMIRFCNDRFLKIVEENARKNVVTETLLRRYTMDVIWNFAFGVDIDCQNHPENPFFKKGVRVFENSASLRWDIHLSTYFHELRKFIIPISFGLSMLFDRFTENIHLVDPGAWLIRNIIVILEKRLSLKSNRRDYVNILLDTMNENLNKENDNKDSKEFDSTSLEKKMTLTEIKLNLVGFLIAGFETVSSAMNSSLYVLAKHPEQLTRLQEEIDSAFKNTGADFDYENLNKLEYMDMFIKEVLRLYPNANFVIARRCTKPCKLNGINVPYNMTLAVDVLSLHLNPDYWGADAKEFNPLRFLPEFKRHPAVYIPFGLGPRTCVGMRLAVIELKYTLAKLLFSYDVLATSETPAKLEFDELPGSIRRPRKPIQVEFRKRELIAN